MYHFVLYLQLGYAPCSALLHSLPCSIKRLYVYMHCLLGSLYPLLVAIASGSYVGLVFPVLRASRKASISSGLKRYSRPTLYARNSPRRTNRLTCSCDTPKSFATSTTVNIAIPPYYILLLAIKYYHMLQYVHAKYSIRMWHRGKETRLCTRNT
jgi:hypothetical protein